LATCHSQVAYSAMVDITVDIAIESVAVGTSPVKFYRCASRW